MAFADNKATVTVTAKVLPAEIQKILTGTFEVAPAGTGDKWYYKLTSVPNSSGNLIAGSFIDINVGIGQTATHTALVPGDKVKFLFIKNITTANSIYVCFNGGTASSSLADAVTIGPGEIFTARLPNTTVENLHAIGSTNGVNCLVAAILEDV